MIIKPKGRLKFALETIVQLENKIAELKADRESYARLQIEKDREDACLDLDTDGCFANGDECNYDNIKACIRNRPITLD